MVKGRRRPRDCQKILGRKERPKYFLYRGERKGLLESKRGFLESRFGMWGVKSYLYAWLEGSRGLGKGVNHQLRLGFGLAWRRG